ncbi:MAG: AAA family ATPase [Xanthobacteraceae bacterium]
MYLSTEAVAQAIRLLKQKVHPFVGITFLACKSYGLKVGDDEKVRLDTLTREHLDKYHVLDRRSRYYFQPFKSPSYWVTERYPSTGLQTVNTQTFQKVFRHAHGTPRWGFVQNYIQEIKRKLMEIKNEHTFAIDAIAVWLYKGADLGDVDSIDKLIDKFTFDFKITKEERIELFCQRSLSDSEKLFTDEPLAISDVARQFESPPDAGAEGGRTLGSLHLVNAGPAADMAIVFGERLTLITGDNGLGKSFLLDFAWWAATGAWVDRPVLPPLQNQARKSEVEYSIRGASGHEASFVSHFDHITATWIRPKEAQTVEALAVFSRADGSFSVADPVRARFHAAGTSNLSSYEVWNGKAGIIEGLVRDWSRWQLARDKTAFDRFSAVLKRLSPEDLGVLRPGSTVRLPGDPRDIPTVEHRYGTVPVTQTSAGVQRILLLAYLIIWAWQEHELAASQSEVEPVRRMIVIVDELEAHLHPKWQRIVLPALMSVGGLLSSELSMQIISATHSPMILASMETTFDSTTDALYHLFAEGAVVTLEETPFVKYGDVSGWLTSPLFGLRHARSREAERAIEDAKALQQQDRPDVAAVAEVSARLRQHLADDDKFWPRWLYFADQHGVTL